MNVKKRGEKLFTVGKKEEEKSSYCDICQGNVDTLDHEMPIKPTH